MSIQAQNPCLKIESILAHACVNNTCGASTEGENEMFRLKVGDLPIAISDLQITWPSGNSFLGIELPNALTATKVAQYNNGINNKSCGKLSEPNAGIIPAGAELIVVSSTNACAAANLFNSLTHEVYIVFQKAGNVLGHFDNYNSTPANETLTVGLISNGCIASASYDVSKLLKVNLVAGLEQGAVVKFLGDKTTYHNFNCQAPYEPRSAKAFGPPGACPGQTIDLSGVVVGDYATLKWSGGTGSFSNTNQLNTQYSINPAESGDIILMLRVTFVCGGTLNAGVTIRVTPPPTVAIFPSDQMVLCDGKAEELSATAGFTSYAWSTGETTNTINVTNAGSYTVTVTDIRGCQGTKTAVVEAASAPIADAGEDKSICQGALIGIGQASSSNNSYSWSPNNDLSNASAANPVASPSVSTQYVLTVTNDLGCTKTDSVLVSVTPKPAKPIVPATVNACSNAPIVIEVNNVESGIYKWFGPNGALPDGPTLTFANPQLINNGTYVVRLLNGNCTSDNATVTLNISQTPVVDAGANRSICEGDTIQLGNVGNSGVEYKWTPNLALSSGSIPNPLAFPKDSVLYFLEADNGQGCTAKDSVLVHVNTVPFKPNIPASIQTCKGEPITVAVSNIENGTYKWFGPNGALPDGSSLSFSNPDETINGTYTVKLIRNGCESETSSTQITIGTMPNPPQVADVSYCQGDIPQSLSANGFKLLWYNTANQTPGSGSINPPAINTNTAGLFTFYVSQGGATCESNKAEIKVTVKPKPAAPSVVNVTYCQFDNAVPLLANGSVGATVFYAASPGAAPSLTTPPVPNTNQVDDFTYEVLQELNACRSSSSFLTVKVMPTPNKPNIYVANSTVCEGKSLQISTDSLPGLSYAWSGPDGFASNLNSFSIDNVSQLNMGIYRLEVMLGTCKSEDTLLNIVVDKSPLPISATPSFIVCEGQDVQLDANAGMGANYSWLGPNAFQSFEQNPLLTAASVLQNGNYVVTASLGNCVGMPFTIEVKVNELPQTAIIESNSPLCEGDTLKLFVVNTQAGVSYDWTAPANVFDTTAKQNIPKAGLDKAGIYSVTAIKNNCSSTTSQIMVAVKPKPVLNQLSNPTKLCEGTSMSLVANSSFSGLDYYWINPQGVKLNSANYTISNATNFDQGIYRIYAVLNACNSDTLSQGITVLPLPKLNQLSATPFCLGDSSIIKVNLAGLAPFQIIYQVNGVFDTLLTSQLNNLIMYGEQGSMVISRINDGQCSALINKSLTLSQYPLASAKITGNAAVCATASAAISVQLTGKAPFEFTIEKDGLPYASHTLYTAQNYSFTSNEVGSYQIKQFRDSACTGSVSGQAILSPYVFNALQITVPAQVCQGEELMLKNTSLPSSSGSSFKVNIASRTYDFVGSNTINLPSDIVACYDVLLTEMAQNGCIQQANFANAYCVQQVAQAIFTLPDSIGIERNVFTPTNNSNAASFYEWTLNGVLISSNESPKIELPTATQLNYDLCLKATNESGCSDSTCRLIAILDETSMFIPNAFTPDGDGYNDIFKPTSANKYASQKLVIYDRWGGIIYIQEGENVSWNGNNAPVGAYTWHLHTINLFGEQRDYKGQVLLIR